MSNDGVCSCCEREGLVLLLSSSFQQETKNPFMKKETEKQREEMGAEGNPNVGWTNEEGGETDFPKHKIQRWWKVPTSFKSVNVLLCWHSNRTSDIFISQSLRWYQRILQRNYPGNQIEDGINSKNNMRKKNNGAEDLNSEISVRWQIGIFIFRYWHC